MARDLLLGKTRRNWARDSCEARLTDEVDFRLTPAEMAMLADLAATKLRADSGDPTARKKISAVKKNVASLRIRAKKGDPKASRALEILTRSGVFAGVQSFSLGGEDTTQVPNVAYRAAVLRQARRTGGKTPTTRDFFRAKKIVDRVMQSAGLSLYLPGSRPGRATA